MQRMTSIKRTNYENVKQLKVWLYKRKEYLKILEKYYIVDIGMRYMLLGTQKIDAGHILENVVYLELLRREVDFVAQNSKGIEYYQVALTVRDEKTLQRELRPLQAIQELP